MVDEPTQRPYRSNETLARSAPAKSPGLPAAPVPGSDPLAELARLIGQNDPFSEFGRDGARHPAQPQPPSANWAAHPSGNGFAPPSMPPPMKAPPQFGSQNFGRQNYGGPDLHQTEHDVPGYPPAHADHGAGYQEPPFDPNNPHHGTEEQDFYDDEPAPRRRMGVLVIAGVFALAVIGTAGAFGYRALFGSSGASGPPPVIKAETAPSKIVPATNKDSQSTKQITDRVNDRGMGEKLVSREEQPVEIKDKPAGVVFPQGQDPSQSSNPQLGSGVVGSDPKRVRTIAIRPDQGSTADATPASAPPAPAAPTRTVAVAPVRQAPPAPPPRVVSNAPPAAEPEPPLAPAPRQAVTRVAPPPQQQATTLSNSNAPMSLSPDAVTPPAPARVAAPRARTAVVAAPTPIAPAAATGGAGGFAVQVSSQRSEAEAQAAFRSLQGKYPTQLGGKQAIVRRVDLGDKGIYFRAMVGPFANGSAATDLCSSLKAAGGSCIIQRN